MKTFCVEIIGCGAIFVLSQAYPLHRLQNVPVKAVCDVKPQTLEFARQLFTCDGYGDYLELLKRGDLDAVHILTPQ